MILADLGNLDNEVQHSHLEDTGHLTQSDHLAGHVGGGEAGQALLGLRQSDGPAGHLLGHHQVPLELGNDGADQVLSYHELNQVIVQDTPVELSQDQQLNAFSSILGGETLQHETSVPEHDGYYQNTESSLTSPTPEPGRRS